MFSFIQIEVAHRLVDAFCGKYCASCPESDCIFARIRSEDLTD